VQRAAIKNKSLISLNACPFCVVREEIAIFADAQLVRQTRFDELHEFPQWERSCNRCGQLALDKFMYTVSKVRKEDIIVTVGYDTITAYSF
jgi:uncharacterized cysteine cluster protein YcgN (CxxCxxCC family)